MEVAADQIDLLHIHNSDYKLEAKQAQHIAVAAVDGETVVVEDRGIPHHFVCTIPVLNWDSYTSE